MQPSVNIKQWNEYLLSGHTGYKDFDRIGQKSAVV